MTTLNFHLWLEFRGTKVWYNTNNNDDDNNNDNDRDESNMFDDSINMPIKMNLTSLRNITTDDQ